MSKPSKFLREQIAAAADASRRGDATEVRRQLDHAVAEDPQAIAAFREALTRRP